MNVFSQGLISVVYKIISIPLTIIIGIITANVLGPEGRGSYTIIVTISTLTSILGMLGMGNSSIYLVNSKGFNFKKVYKSLFWFSLFWALVIVAISSTFFRAYPSIIGDLELENIRYIYVISFLMICNGFIAPMLITKQRVKAIGSVSLITQISQLFFILASYFLYPSLIFDLVVFSYITSICISIFAVILYEKAWYLLIPTFDLEILKEVLLYGLKIYVGNFMLVLNLQFDAILINYFMTSKAVGLYSVSVMLCNFLLVIPSAIGPVLYSNWSQNKGVKSEDVIRACRIIFFSLSFIGCAVVVFGYKFIIIAYGADFAQAYVPLIILIPGVINMGLCYSLFNYFSSIGKPEVTSIILFICFLFNVILNVTLIPIVGINGAAISSLISYSLSALFGCIYFAKTVKVRLYKIFAEIISIRGLLFDIHKIVGAKK